jgi:hypothetical protein
VRVNGLPRTVNVHVTIDLPITVAPGWPRPPRILPPPHRHPGGLPPVCRSAATAVAGRCGRGAEDSPVGALPWRDPVVFRPGCGRPRAVLPPRRGGAHARPAARGVAVERNGDLLWPSEDPATFTPAYMVGYAGVAVGLLRLADPRGRPRQLTRAGSGRAHARRPGSPLTRSAATDTVVGVKVVRSDPPAAGRDDRGRA